MTGLGFPGQYRLKKTDEFSSVFNFRKRVTGTVLALHYMPNSFGHARLGVVVGKKTAKLSVQRNYMKRTLRELFRQHKITLGAIDILIRPLKAYSRDEFTIVETELEQLLNKLRNKVVV